MGLAIGTGLLIVFAHVQSSATPIDRRVPELHPHPLPPSLAQWQEQKNSGDYFSQVRATEVGYLVWSQFPIKVYVERGSRERGAGSRGKKGSFSLLPAPSALLPDEAQRWVTDVLQAVEEWNVYLPLEVVEQPEKADITIVRSRPPLGGAPTGDRPRARSAETSYELYISNASTTPGVLSHRCTILLSPSQTSKYLQASARHELGHALGIWGHSPVATDALYSSQVRNPPPISPRDLNTLKRVYEQPTRLGWPLLSRGAEESDYLFSPAQKEHPCTPAKISTLPESAVAPKPGYKVFPTARCCA